MSGTAWLGIDTGGTFTDFVWYDPSSGRTELVKVPSNPLELELVCEEAMVRLGRQLADVDRVVHGTTLVTNTVLEGNGARVGVVTTRGFRDLIEIGRQNRHEMYNLKTLAVPALAPRRWRFEVDERTDRDGGAKVPLSLEQVREAGRALTAAGVEAIAVCFLFSHLSPANEISAAAALREVGGWFVSGSQEVVRQAREFERFSTAVLNAYVGPRVNAYLDRLQGYLEGEQVESRRVFLIGATGGAMSWSTARSVPVRLLNSGPAGGVRGAVEVARVLGMPNIITHDMGGTSTDVCLIKDLEPVVTSEGEVEGRPLVVPQLDIVTIGAGGGSIAWIDIGGELRIGPQSAGADPGPACYGRGGIEPTVTDANLVLGRLGESRPLGGTVRLDRAAAATAVATLAESLPGLSLEEVAEGIVRLAVAKMRTALREVSIARGLDPRDFVLFAYGGAGPMHATEVAAELGIQTVVVPSAPGNFSALGLLMSNVRHDYVQSRFLDLASLATEEYERIFVDLESQAHEQLAAEGFSNDRIRTSRSADVRYRGQWFELNVPMPVRPESMEAIDTLFRTAHRERFQVDMERPTEFVSFRVAGEGVTDKPRVQPLHSGGTAAPERRRAVFGGLVTEVTVHVREMMAVGDRFQGPAVIEEFGATTVVIEGFSGRVDATGALVLTQIGGRT